VAAQVAPRHHLRRATSSTRCWPGGEAQGESRRAAEQTGGGRIGSAAARVPRSRTSARGQQDQIEPERVVARDEEVQGPSHQRRRGPGAAREELEQGGAMGARGGSSLRGKRERPSEWVGRVETLTRARLGRWSQVGFGLLIRLNQPNPK
jgi:hypothetical protein